MARKPPPEHPSNSRVKVRVFEFEMDGSDESIQDTMKTLAAALTRGGAGVAAPVTRRIRSDISTVQADADQSDGEEVDIVEDESIDDLLAKPPVQAKKPKKIQTYDILDDIRFDEVQPTLSDFAARLGPKSDLKKYLAVALWYKEHLKLAEINVRHWYTAFKYLKWTIPIDPAQPIRDLRRQRKLSKGKEVGHSFINHIGEKDFDDLTKAV